MINFHVTNKQKIKKDLLTTILAITTYVKYTVPEFVSVYNISSG